MQLLADPSDFPLWVSAVRPGSTYDLTAVRDLVLPALYPHAARGLPMLADEGYTGAGIGIRAGRWGALDRVPPVLQRIGALAAGALVLTSLDRGSR